MKKRSDKRKYFIGLGIVLFAVVLAAAIYLLRDISKIGNEVDSYQDVEVYYNGILYTRAYGKHYADNGYYLGQKWQCVEFVKRFYYQAKGHEMPDVYGHAKDFFDYETDQGELNERRGLIQYYNGREVPPQKDDLLVFTDSDYGHVGIITEVTDNEVEIIQQNVYGKPRSRYSLTIKDGRYYVGADREPAGWLRIK